MEPSMTITMLFVVWGVVTIVLFVLLLYRATLSTREDDQIFIGSSERIHADEQQEIVARMARLRGPIIALTTISVILFVSAVSFWIYTGLSS